MKNIAIRIVKSNPILYKGAKKIYRTFQPAKPTLYRNHDYSMVYQIKAPEKMSAVLEHFGKYRKNNTRLVVIVSGNTRVIHLLFRDYPGVIFLSMDYYKKYQKKLNIKNMILTDTSQPVTDIIDLI